MSLEVTDAQIAYQREMRTRLFCGVATPFIAALFVSLPVMIWPSSAWFHERAPVEIVGFLAFPIFICLCGLMIVVTGLYGAGPEELIIDLTTRAYRFRRGFPLLARWQTGALSDVEAVYVRTYQNKSTTLYWIMLAWQGQGRQTWFPIGDGRLETRKDITLSSNKSREEANTQAQTLAAKLGVPAEPAGSERYGQNSEQVRKRAEVIVALVLTASLLMLLLSSGPTLLIQYQLDTQGRTTQGEIVNRWSGKSSHIQVAYQVNGRAFKNTDEVKYTDYKNLSPHASVQVTYLPNYPKTSRANVSNERRSAAVMLIVYGGWLLGVGLWYIFKRKRPRK